MVAVGEVVRAAPILPCLTLPALPLLALPLPALPLPALVIGFSGSKACGTHSYEPKDEITMDDKL